MVRGSDKYLCFDVCIICEDTGAYFRKKGLESRKAVKEFLDQESKFHPFCYVVFGVTEVERYPRAARAQRLWYGHRSVNPVSYVFPN